MFPVEFSVFHSPVNPALRSTCSHYGLHAQALIEAVRNSILRHMARKPCTYCVLKKASSLQVKILTAVCTYDLNMGWAVGMKKPFPFIGKRGMQRQDCVREDANSWWV